MPATPQNRPPQADDRQEDQATSQASSKDREAREQTQPAEEWGERTATGEVIANGGKTTKPGRDASGGKE